MHRNSGSKRSKNPIWNFFEKLECDKRRAMCKECGNTVSLGSDKPKYQSVVGLRCHLRRWHQEQNELYLKRVADREVERSAKRVKHEFAEMEYPAIFEMPDQDSPGQDLTESVEEATAVNPVSFVAYSDVQNGDLTGIGW